MRMDMGMAPEQEQKQEMRPSPTLIAFTKMLALSGLELQETISQELEANPALERNERDVCPLCGEPLVNGRCWRCHDELSQRKAVTGGGGGDEFDLLTIVGGQMTMAEYILQAAQTALDDEDHPIAEYIVGNLDERGFLDMTLPDIARTLGVEVERVQTVFETVQQAGPVGVGARNPRECLMLQLEQWAAQDKAHLLARPILEEHFEELGRGKYGQIARSLDVEYEDVVEARDFIRDHLRPYAIPDYSPLEDWPTPTETPYVAPDVVITRQEELLEEFRVTVVESERYGLHLNPMYREMASQIKMGDEIEHVSDDEQEHVQRYVSRARAFLSHLQERRRTLRKVAEYVVQRQKPFLRHGTRYLQPLTQSEVADALGVHESTVSRAVADKYVLLPNQQVIPFRHFFRPALGVQDVLREIIESEDEPMTDAELAEALHECGFDVARRTVAKYRNRMGILPSSLR